MGGSVIGSISGDVADALSGVNAAAAPGSGTGSGSDGGAPGSIGSLGSPGTNVVTPADAISGTGSGLSGTRSIGGSAALSGGAPALTPSGGAGAAGAGTSGGMSAAGGAAPAGIGGAPPGITDARDPNSPVWGSGGNADQSAIDRAFSQAGSGYLSQGGNSPLADPTLAGSDQVHYDAGHPAETMLDAARRSADVTDFNALQAGRGTGETYTSGQPPSAGSSKLYSDSLVGTGQPSIVTAAGGPSAALSLDPSLGAVDVLQSQEDPLTIAGTGVGPTQVALPTISPLDTGHGGGSADQFGADFPAPATQVADASGGFSVGAGSQPALGGAAAPRADFSAPNYDPARAAFGLPASGSVPGDLTVADVYRDSPDVGNLTFAPSDLLTAAPDPYTQAIIDTGTMPPADVAATTARVVPADNAPPAPWGSLPQDSLVLGQRESTNIEDRRPRDEADNLLPSVNAGLPSGVYRQDDGSLAYRGKYLPGDNPEYDRSIYGHTLPATDYSNPPAVPADQGAVTADTILQALAAIGNSGATLSAVPGAVSGVDATVAPVVDTAVAPPVAPWAPGVSPSGALGGSAGALGTAALGGVPPASPLAAAANPLSYYDTGVPLIAAAAGDAPLSPVSMSPAEQEQILQQGSGTVRPSRARKKKPVKEDA